MRDVTEIFKQAILSNTDWRFSEFYQAIERLKSKDIEVSFWDGEDNWASVGVHNIVYGYIWKRFPLIIFEKEKLPGIHTFLEEVASVQYIEVTSLTEEQFMVNDDMCKDHFEEPLDAACFTMDDLWFYTN